MRLVEISSITIPADRQRKEGKDSRSLVELKSDIAARGLYHPPVLTEGLELVIGERRLIAMTELHQEGIEFSHDGELVPKNCIPYTLFTDALLVSRLQAEFHENLLRLNLTWQEETLAKVRIHELLVQQNPSQTKLQTAEKLLTLASKPVTPAATIVESKELVRAQMVAEHLNMPAVAAATSVRKAYDKILDLKQQQLERDLLSLRPSTTPHKLILGDCKKELLALESHSFDLILSDPPYGISAHKHSEGTLHQYDDSPDHALNLYRFIFQRGFDLLKPQGAIFLFCDIEHFLTLRVMAEQQAFSTWRTPIVWHKGPEGHAPWGRDGFKRTYEIGLYAVKGQRPLVLNGGSDVKLVPRATVNVDKLHAAEKPAELLRWLLQLTCRAGDKVLDPCCGSAPIFPAAKGLGVQITAIEINPDYHAAAASRLFALDSEATPTDHVVIKPTMSDMLSEMLDD